MRPRAPRAPRVFVSVLLACGLVAACGSKPAVPRDLPTLSGDPPPSDAGTTTTTTTVTPVARASSGLTPELIAAVGKRPLIIEDFTSLRLSASERLRAQSRIAEWANASGLIILPPDVVEATLRKAAAGLDPTTGKTCGPALERAYAIERWIVPTGAEGSILARVDCEDSCTIQLEIKLFALGTEFYSAPFDPAQPWEQELVRRLPTVIDNGGHERYGHLNNPVRVAGVPRAAKATDWYFDDAAIVAGRAATEVLACGAMDRAVVLMLDRADNGATTCETAGAPNYVAEYDARINACACAAAIKLEHPTAKRSYVQYPGHPRAGDETTKNGKRISASLIGGNEYRPRGTAPWILRESDSIAPCFVGRTTETAADEVNATLEFDQTGSVTKVTIGDLKGMLHPDERACVTKKLKTIRTPCPAGPPLTGQVRITLEVRGP